MSYKSYKIQEKIMKKKKKSWQLFWVMECPTGCYGIGNSHKGHMIYCTNLIKSDYIWYGVAFDF